MVDGERGASGGTAKILLVLAVATLLAVSYRSGLLDLFADPQRLARALVEMGVWGYVAFVVTYAVLQPFGVPGTIFILAAPLIWPWPVAFALSMIGTMAASVVGFAFARFVARDWVKKRIPPRFAKYEDALHEREFLTVFLLRFVFWMPPMLHAFFGVSRVGFWAHFWGSLAGYVVPLLLVSIFGQTFFQALREVPLGVWIGGGVVTILVVGVWVWRR